MKARVATQVSINASASDVFAYLSNTALHHLWNPPLRSVSPHIKLETGSTYQTVAVVLGIEIRAKNKIVKCLPNKELEIENKTGLVQYHVNYKLRSSRGTTLVRCTINVHSDSKAFAFTTPVLEMLARRELKSDLQALKIAVEQKLTKL